MFGGGGMGSGLKAIGYVFMGVGPVVVRVGVGGIGVAHTVKLRNFRRRRGRWAGRAGRVGRGGLLGALFLRRRNSFAVMANEWGRERERAHARTHGAGVGVAGLGSLWCSHAAVSSALPLYASIGYALSNQILSEYG